MEAVYEVKKLGKGVKIKAKGSLSISNAEEFKILLLESIPENGNCTLFLKELESLDITSVQVVASLNLMLAERGNSLNVFWPDSPALKDLLDKLQLKKIVNL